MGSGSSCSPLVLPPCLARTSRLRCGWGHKGAQRQRPAGGAQPALPSPSARDSGCTWSFVACVCGEQCQGPCRYARGLAAWPSMAAWGAGPKHHALHDEPFAVPSAPTTTLACDLDNTHRHTKHTHTHTVHTHTHKPLQGRLGAAALAGGQPCGKGAPPEHAHRAACSTRRTPRAPSAKARGQGVVQWGAL